MRVRIVDRDAMRLPADTSGEGLPRYRVPGNARLQTAGPFYVDPNVRTAAKTAGYLHDFLAAWDIDTVQVDLSGLGLTSVNGTRILWGHAPGCELSTEAPAARKRDWLRAYFESHGRTTDRRFAVLLDVRGPTEMTVQQIPVVGKTSR